MKLLIVSTAPFIYKKDFVYAYGPYVSELIIWNKCVDTIAFCCPVWDEFNGLLVSKLPFGLRHHFKLIDFNLNSLVTIFKASFFIFYNLVVLIRAMIWADHIHLRCPGNVGLLGCFVQMFFPSKPKTAKYAGNWDSKSKEPWSYRLQKWILSNTFLTQNIQVLVYGEWANQSGNIKPFFTATYSEREKEAIQKTINSDALIKLMFVGSLVAGKNPMYAIQLVKQLIKQGKKAVLNIYGEGIEKSVLEKYIKENQLENHIVLHGNQNREILKKAYQKSHFVILASKSEGWPKAIAEGMFWGSVPLATAVSCVHDMLDYGSRGILLEMDLDKDVAKVNELINNPVEFEKKSSAAANWSGNYTLDCFENEIQKLLQCE